MSTGADSKTMAQTKAFDAGHERIYGNRKPQRGRWVQDPATGKLIPAHEYVPPHSNDRVPLVSDLFMDGAGSQDGVDIGSRRKRREYMRATNSVDASDCSKKWLAERRAEPERRTAELTRKTVAEVAKLDTRHLPKYLDEGKKR